MLALTPDFLVHLVFYLFSGVAIASAMMVVVSNNPVKGALFLVLAFITMAAVWVMANAQFLGLILIVVYVGAVMTLFLFVVMMLKLDLQSLRRQLWHYVPMALVVAVLVSGVLFVVIRAEKSLPVPHLSSHVQSSSSFVSAGTVSEVPSSGVDVSSDHEITGDVVTAGQQGGGNLTLVNLGNALYGRDAYPVEIAAILLLAAIIAAIALAFRGPQERLGQETNEQVAVRREDYVRIVKMKSEKKQ